MVDGISTLLSDFVSDFGSVSYKGRFKKDMCEYPFSFTSNLSESFNNLARENNPAYCRPETCLNR